MATIENVNDRTILQQFHSLYERQNETETNVQNIDAKIDQETINRQTADLSINTEIQALKDQIDSLGVLFTYKGEVATIQDLPATDNKPGDVYYVDSEQSEYIWIEKSSVYQWEQFGPAIDLSEYAKQEDLQQLKSEVDAMNTQVESNTSNIVSLTNTKQDKLTAGTGITIDQNNVISSSADASNLVTTNTYQTITSKKLINETALIFGYSGTYTGFRGAPFTYGGLVFNKYTKNGDQIGCQWAIEKTNSTIETLKTPGKSGTLALTSDIDAKVPNAPDTDGTYTLKCVVSNGVKTYQWILDA